MQQQLKGLNKMNGHKLNAIKRTSRKDALLAQLIFMMGKFHIDYAMLARLCQRHAYAPEWHNGNSDTFYALQ